MSAVVAHFCFGIKGEADAGPVPVADGSPLLDRTRQQVDAELPLGVDLALDVTEQKLL